MSRCTKDSQRMITSQPIADYSLTPSQLADASPLKDRTASMSAVPGQREVAAVDSALNDRTKPHPSNATSSRGTVTQSNRFKAPRQVELAHQRAPPSRASIRAPARVPEALLPGSPHDRLMEAHIAR